jgi:hypothetical protein
MELEGGCLCGAVRYRISGTPRATRYCWCRVCQFIGAGSATVNVLVDAGDFTLHGALADFASLADSGSHMHRRFCPCCGTHVCATADERPHLVVVRVGTLDCPAAVQPTQVIWAGSAPAWACLDSNLAQVAGQPPPL